jgi:putative transposase
LHLLVGFPPKVSLSTLVNSLKGVSARRLRAARLPDVERKLWGPHFWSPSYCAVSCGGAPLEIVKQYVAAQRAPPRPEGRGFRPGYSMNPPIWLPLNLNIGCADPGGCLRWQTGGPPTDVDLAVCTVTASIWQPQAFTSPIVTITQTLSAYGQLVISTFSGASVPSLVSWQWLPAAVAALGLAPPLDELRLSWGMNITFPSTPTAPWALIRGPCTVRP